MSEQTRSEALGDLIGALCYALLKVAHIAAAGAAAAPTARLADRQAAFAADELERFKILRRRLDDLTDDADRAMQTLRDTLDGFYDAAGGESWLETQVFHFVGNTLTTDFADLLASRVDDETAKAVRRALTGRTEQETFALSEIARALEEDGPGARDQIARQAKNMVGHGLTRLRDALLRSAAVAEVLGDDAEVKEIVLELLGRHRERLERLGLDTLDE